MTRHTQKQFSFISHHCQLRYIENKLNLFKGLAEHQSNCEGTPRKTGKVDKQETKGTTEEWTETGADSEVTKAEKKNIEKNKKLISYIFEMQFYH